MSSDFFIEQMCLLNRVFVFTREENSSECDVACERYRIPSTCNNKLLGLASAFAIDNGVSSACKKQLLLQLA